MIAPEKFDKIMSYISSLGQFMQVHPAHCRYLKGDAAAILVLSYILNVLRMKNKNPKDRCRLMSGDLFFSCPVQDVQEQTGLSKDRQQSAFERLKNQGIIRTKIGVHYSRLVKIVYKTLKKMEDESTLVASQRRETSAAEPSVMTSQRRETSAVSGGKPPPSAAGNLRRSHTNNPSNTPITRETPAASASLPEEEPAVVGELTPGEKEEGRSTGRESRRCQQPGLVVGIKKKTKTKKKVDPKHVAAAAKLNQSLHKNNRVTDNRGGWPGVFAALEKSIGKDYTEVLDWYCDHCSEEEERKCGLPSIQSASQFSRCYDWIRRQKEKMHKKEWDYTGSVIDGPSRKLTDWRDLQ